MLLYLSATAFVFATRSSTSAYEFIKDHVTEIEKYYYASNGRNVRLFDESQFEKYFNKFDKVVLNEVVETRFKH